MRCEGSLRQAENCNIFFIGENSFRDDFSPFFTRDRCPELAAPPVRFERRPIFSSATLLFERLPVCKRSGPSIISHLVNCRVRRRNHGRVAESGLRHSTRNRAWVKPTVGSNPTPSATPKYTARVAELRYAPRVAHWRFERSSTGGALLRAWVKSDALTLEPSAALDNPTPSSAMLHSKELACHWHIQCS